jgi:S-DNA-T family DNA segregation ATPase FtsK/SpoIIIE
MLTVPVTDLLLAAEPSGDNGDAAPVMLRDVLGSPTFVEHLGALPIVLGVDDSGDTHIVDLATTPNILIAGTTGSGKSSFMHSALASLLVRHDANDLNLLLIDTGGLELPAYAAVPHVRHRVTRTSADALAALEWGAREVAAREKLLVAHGCRTIAEFNRRGQRLPYLVYVIDDIASLAMFEPEACGTVTMLAEHGRAVGMHLVLVTSLPMACCAINDIAQLAPMRIAFRLTSRHDSETVLGVAGAEGLGAPGHMLYVARDTNAQIHLRAAYIPKADTERLIAFMK